MKNKKITAIILAAMMAMGMVTGCGSDGASKATEKSANASTVTGTVDEIKDFMFVIETEDGAFYSFPREDGIDLSEISVGDEITVEYEGTISEIDAFDGEVLSVEKE